MNTTRIARAASLAATLLLPAAIAGSVTGTVLDEKGKPVPNALVWVQPALTGFSTSGNLVKVRTDAQGRYRAESLLNMPYVVKAWRTLTFDGRSYCQRLGMPNVADYDSFVPKGTTVRNFKAQFGGLIGDELSNAGSFGGDVRAMHFFDDTSDILDAREIVVTFTPLALADGRKGKAFTRTFTPTSDMMRDIPLGRYTVTAVAFMPSGAKRPVKLSMNDAPYASSATLTFKPTGTCDSGNGLERAFLYYSGQ